MLNNPIFFVDPDGQRVEVSNFLQSDVSKINKMKKIFFCHWLLLFYACSFTNSKQHPNHYVYSGRVNSKILLQDKIQYYSIFDRIKTNYADGDTVVNIELTNPLLDIRIEDVYFIYTNHFITKCLVQTPSIGKGLIYFEVDTLDDYKIHKDFGGWVKGLNNIVVKENKNRTALSFNISSEGNFGLNYTGTCLIESNNAFAQYHINFIDYCIKRRN